MYVLSVNFARNELNLTVCNLKRINPALAGVVLVFFAMQCLNVFIMLLIFSWRSVFGFSSPGVVFS